MQHSQTSLLLSSISSYMNSADPIMNKGHPVRLPTSYTSVDPKENFQTLACHLDQPMASSKTLFGSSSTDMETLVREAMQNLLIPSIREEDYHLPSQNISPLSSVQEDCDESEYKLNKTSLQHYINSSLTPRASPFKNFPTKEAVIIPSKSQNQLERSNTAQSKRQTLQSETHGFYQRSNRKSSTQTLKTNLNFTIIWPEKTEGSQSKSNHRIHKPAKGDGQRSKTLASPKRKVTLTNEIRVISPKFKVLKPQKTKKIRDL